MDLAMTQVTLQSMKRHSSSTLVAMAPKEISSWIGEVNDDNVRVTMAYVVPKETIGGEEECIVDGSSRQVKHKLLQIPFKKIHNNLSLLDKWSTSKATSLALHGED
jgi:hypothetical protein